jgi:phosphoenolpyruvate carboxylase
MDAASRVEDPPLRSVESPATDRLLREDVKQLGALVGEVLAEQESPAFLLQVEAIRVAAIRRRENGEPIDCAGAGARRLPLEQAESLVRAFALWFQAVNLAERVHRIRRRRDYEKTGAAPQPGGLAAVMLQLQAEGVSLAELAAVLQRLHIEPVFTAHPTEAVRRALLEQGARCRSTPDRGYRPGPDAGGTAQEPRAHAGSAHIGWQTSELAAFKPTVRD